MEVYPEKWTVHCIMRLVHVVMCAVHFSTRMMRCTIHLRREGGVTDPSAEMWYSYYLYLIKYAF